MRLTQASIFGVVQAFQKVPALSVMAPNQNEPPFVITQLVVLGLFIVLAIAAVKGFRGEPIHTA